MVLAAACNSTPLPTSVPRRRNTAQGPGSTYVGLRPSHTTACQMRRKMPVARSLGHAADHTRRDRLGAGETGTSRASMPASSTSSVSVVGVVVGMAAYLLAQALGDFSGHRRHLGRLEPAGPGDVNGKL